MGRLTRTSRPPRSGTVRTLCAGSAVLLALGGLCAAGCGRSPARPVRLVDGTAPPPLPAPLRRRAAGATTARVAVLAAGRLDAAGRRCLASFRPEFRIAPGTTVVRRTGAAGESLTFTDADREVVLGCDRASLRAPDARGWCGRSVGRLVAGRLRDPRLDLGCRSHDGAAVGFGWIEPGPATRWIGVRVARSTEVDEVAAGLPVRVPTDDVDRATSSAAFSIVEYTGAGAVARRYRLRAGVAG
jgi:hypothetical protein